MSSSRKPRSNRLSVRAETKTPRQWRGVFVCDVTLELVADPVRLVEEATLSATGSAALRRLRSCGGPERSRRGSVELVRVVFEHCPWFWTLPCDVLNARMAALYNEVLTLPETGQEMAATKAFLGLSDSENRLAVFLKHSRRRRRRRDCAPRAWPDTAPRRSA